MFRFTLTFMVLECSFLKCCFIYLTPNSFFQRNLKVKVQMCVCVRARVRKWLTRLRILNLVWLMSEWKKEWAFRKNQKQKQWSCTGKTIMTSASQITRCAPDHWVAERCNYLPWPGPGATRRMDTLVFYLHTQSFTELPPCPSASDCLLHFAGRR